MLVWGWLSIAAVMECQSDEVCSELQHQVCRDTDGDGRPDTCLCEDGYYLRLSSCEVFGIGKVFFISIIYTGTAQGIYPVSWITSIN